MTEQLKQLNDQVAQIDKGDCKACRRGWSSSTVDEHPRHWSDHRDGAAGAAGREKIEAIGATLLSPLEPNSSPIEKAFSRLKAMAAQGGWAYPMQLDGAPQTQSLPELVASVAWSHM